MPSLQKIKMYYDPLGRVVRTVNPDKSEQRVVYGVPTALNTPDNYAPTPWENFSYDADDLAPLTNGVSYGCDYTPKSYLVDGLGRTISTTEHLGSSADDITMHYSYDVRGNLLLIKDPYYRNVFEHVYDLRAPQKGEDGNNQPLPPIKTKHIDQGTSTILFDATGKPIEKHDAKGAQSLSAYDVISRPVDAWARDNSSAGAPTLRSHIEYGDTAGSGSSGNMNGKPYQSYDEAGMVETSDYDFKGNLLIKTRYVINSATLKAQLVGYNSFIIDWTGLPGILDMGMPFQTDLQYDALNRVTVMTLPQDVSGNRLDITPTYNRAGALEKVDYDGTNYVENIAYNAKGQRLLIAYGNGIMTRYVYDPVIFRLLRYKTEGYVKSQVGNTITYAYQSGTNRQDDAFNYDLVGNILNVFTRVTDCGINSSPLGSNALDRNFSYDAIYRVLTANGRESNSQNQNSYLYSNAPAPGSPNANNVRSYGHVYSYDKLGNIDKMIQTGTNGFTRNFVYNTGVNTLQRVNDGSAVLIEAFIYDANGNQLTAGTTRNYKWNHADQLICYYNKAGLANPTVFTQYDYSGQDRVSKLVRTGTAGSPIYERTIYIDGIFEYVRLENGPTYQKNYIHIMDDSTRIAEVRVNVGAPFPGDIVDSVVYQLGDQIGSSVVRLNNSGGVIDREEYYPFGDSSLRTFSYKRYRYVSKERDSESGLYYYGARYYAAWTCRFISVDPMAAKYNQLTPYQNAGNNPINDYDIDGMQGANTPDAGNNGNGGGSGGNSGQTAQNSQDSCLAGCTCGGTMTNPNYRVIGEGDNEILQQKVNGKWENASTLTEVEVVTSKPEWMKLGLSRIEVSLRMATICLGNEQTMIEINIDDWLNDSSKSVALQQHYAVLFENDNKGASIMWGKGVLYYDAYKDPGQALADADFKITGGTKIGIRGVGLSSWEITAKNNDGTLLFSGAVGGPAIGMPGKSDKMDPNKPTQTKLPPTSEKQLDVSKVSRFGPPLCDKCDGLRVGLYSESSARRDSVLSSWGIKSTNQIDSAKQANRIYSFYQYHNARVVNYYPSK